MKVKIAGRLTVTAIRDNISMGRVVLPAKVKVVHRQMVMATNNDTSMDPGPHPARLLVVNSQVMATSNRIKTRISNKTRVKVIPRIKTRNKMGVDLMDNNQVDPAIQVVQMVRADPVIPADLTIPVDLTRTAELATPAIPADLAIPADRMTPPVVQEIPTDLVGEMVGAK